jgi:hypothetical protein
MTAQEIAEAAFQAFNKGDLAAADRLFRELIQHVPDWLPARYGLGMTCFQRGNYAEAAPLLRLAFGGGIGLPDSWTYHCHALAMLDQDEALAEALALPLGPDIKANLAFQIFNNRLANQNAATVLPLYARLPDEPALRMPGAFWAGIVCAAGEPVLARDYFQAALKQAAALAASGVNSPLVASHIAAGDGIETDDFVLAAGQEPAGLSGEIEWLDPPTLADPRHGVFFAAADGAYVEAFAEDCLASLAALGPGRTLHLHVVDLPADIAARIEAMRDAHPGAALRVSVENPDRGDAVYYACARFLLLPELMVRYATTVTVIDIDCFFQPAAQTLPEPCGAADVAMVRLDTVFPWLQYPAAMVIVRDTPGGRGFAALIQSFLRRKLAGRRSWTLDQAALFCVIGAIRRKRPDISLALLGEVAGLTLDDLVRSQGSFEAKRALRLKTT